MERVEKTSSCKQKEERSAADDDGKVQMKRRVNWFTGSSLIISTMIGSGIFISPQAVLEYSGSIGASLLIWLGSGILATFGAMSYAEVGTMIPKSGGEFPIIFEAFGSFPAFLFAWTSCLVLKPSALAILSLTFAKYSLAPFFAADCSPPNLALKLTAIVVILIIVFINSTSVKLSTGFLNVFSIGKIISLIVIIIGGIVMLANGNTSSFQNMFESNYTPSPKEIVLAFYQGLWSYDGWNQLNYIMEELKNPEKSLTKSITLAMVVVTSLYIFTNISYLTVMSAEDMINSTAVGFTFGERVLGPMKWLIPVAVSSSVLGTCLSSCFAAGRISFVAAREKQFPELLSMLHVTNLTPSPAVIVNGILAILMVIPNDFNSLVSYFSFSTWIFYFLTCSSLIYFRWERPKAHRPFKVNILIPFVVVLCSLCLIFVPLFDDPQIEYLYAALFIFSGTLFYVPFVRMNTNVGRVARDRSNIFLQKLLLVSKSED